MVCHAWPHAIHKLAGSRWSKAARAGEMVAATALAYVCRRPSCCPLGHPKFLPMLNPRKGEPHQWKNVVGIPTDTTGPPGSADRNCKDTLHPNCVATIVPMVWTQSGLQELLPASLCDVSWSFDTKMLCPTWIRSGIRCLHALIPGQPWYKYQPMLSA